MKKLIQYISAGLLSLIALSCNNHFLNEESDISAFADWRIYISPEWEAADYSINITTAENSKFSIIKTPDWLHVNNKSGQFINGSASINCSASMYNDYSAIGVYNSSIIMDIEGKGKCIVPVSYITEGNPVIKVEKNIALLYFFYGSTFNDTINIDNTGEGVLLFGIEKKPDWITFLLPSGTVLTDKTLYPIPPHSSIPLILLPNNMPFSLNDSQEKIVITSNDKNHNKTTINLTYGDPLLNTSYRVLNFGRNETTQTFQICNYGYGLLMWEIESCPEWLTVSETSGITVNSNCKTVTFTCNRNLLPKGRYTSNIYLRTNDKNKLYQTITFMVINEDTANPENIRAITGTIVEAWMDKSTDILYLATSQPNRLLAYNTRTKTIEKELSLNKAPTCFSVSEDNHKAVIGHDEQISYVDMDNFTVIKTFDVNYNIFDIEWGADNWCCYTQGVISRPYYLQWKNLDTGEIFETQNNGYYLDNYVFIKKIPNQDYIIATYINTTIVFCTKTREYVRRIFHFFNNFWLSSDGKYFFSILSANIFKTSSFIVSDQILPIAELSPNPSAILWSDFGPASHDIWVLSPSSEYVDFSRREIQQYEDIDYTRVKTYYYDEYYKGNRVEAHYFFVNSSGNEIIVIKNIVSNNNLNDWSIEHIPNP